MPCRFEYVTAQLDFNNPSSFNELGAEGWELVTVTPVDTLVVGIFKRTIEEPSPIVVATERVMMPQPFIEFPPVSPEQIDALKQAAQEWQTSPNPYYVPPENIQHYETGNGYAAFYHYP